MTTALGYVRPTELGDALRQMDEHASAVLAGGTDLVLLRADRVVDPAIAILDIKEITELQGLRVRADGSTWVGAATTLQHLARCQPANAITDGAGLVGGWQTRARGTIGGNICRASPAGDTLPGTLVMNTQFRLESVRGVRSVPATEFYRGPGRTALEQGEILTQIIVPPSPGASAYQRFTYRRAMDLAVVGVAAYVEMTDGQCSRARLAIGAAAPTPIAADAAAQVLVGTALDDAAIGEAANLVVAETNPIDDGRGTRAHRLHVLPALTRRAIAVAHRRAIEKTEGKAGR